VSPSPSARAAPGSAAGPSAGVWATWQRRGDRDHIGRSDDRSDESHPGCSWSAGRPGVPPVGRWRRAVAGG